MKSWMRRIAPLFLVIILGMCMVVLGGCGDDYDSSYDSDDSYDSYDSDYDSGGYDSDYDSGGYDSDYDDYDTDNNGTADWHDVDTDNNGDISDDEFNDYLDDWQQEIDNGY